MVRAYRHRPSPDGTQRYTSVAHQGQNAARRDTARAMSQENVEIVRRVYDALNRGDWDAVFRDMHPDVEVTTQRGPAAGTHRGRQAVQGFIEDYNAAFESVVSEPEEFLENGDQVLALVNRRARPKGGSIDIEVRNGHLWTVRGGTILSMRSFPDPEEAIEAAVLRE